MSDTKTEEVVYEGEDLDYKLMEEQVAALSDEEIETWIETTGTTLGQPVDFNGQMIPDADLRAALKHHRDATTPPTPPEEDEA